MPEYSGVVTGRKLRLGLGQVEGPAVDLGVAGYEVYDEGDDGGDVSLEYEPSVGLTLDDLGELHGIGEHDDRQDRQTDRELVADHLRAASHGADERVLVV